MKSIVDVDRRSIEINSKSDYHNKDGIIFEGDVSHIICVFIPSTSALHLHSLTIVFTDCRLHDILVSLIFPAIY